MAPAALSNTLPAPVKLLESTGDEHTAGQISRLHGLPARAVDAGTWGTVADGRRCFHLIVEAEEARALRVHFRNFDVGDGKVWVFSADGDRIVGPYSQRGRFGDGDFWTEAVTSNRIVVQYEPAGPTAGVPFEIPEAMSFVEIPKAPSEKGKAETITLLTGGRLCYGTLLNDKQSSGAPFVLTNDPCIRTKDEARQVLAIFGHSGDAGRDGYAQVSGATLLTGSEAASVPGFSFILLSRLPANYRRPIRFAGWSSDALADLSAENGLAGFQSIYHQIATFLSSGAGKPAGSPSVAAWVVANPNPINVQPGTGVGQTTVFWSAEGVAAVDLRVGSANGPSFTGIREPIGWATTDLWVRNGMEFYLQDASSGNSTGDHKTLARVRVTAVGGEPPTGTIRANPNPIPLGGSPFNPSDAVGLTTLQWESNATAVEIRVGSAYGTSVTGVRGPNGSAGTGNWVTNGMEFFLQDASDGNSAGPEKTIARVIVTTYYVNYRFLEEVAGTYAATSLGWLDGISGWPTMASSRWCTADPSRLYREPIKQLPESEIWISRDSGGNFYLTMANMRGAELPLYTYPLMISDITLGSVEFTVNASSTSPWSGTADAPRYGHALGTLRFGIDYVGGREVVRARAIRGPHFSFLGSVPPRNGYCDTTYRDDLVINHVKR
jgi:hypothetical protein